VTSKEPLTAEDQQQQFSDHDYAKVETLKLKDKSERLRKRVVNDSFSVLDKRLEFLSSTKESHLKPKSMKQFFLPTIR